MARKKKGLKRVNAPALIEHEDIENGEIIEEDEEPEELLTDSEISEEDELSAILSSLGGNSDIEISVYKLSGAGYHGKNAFCFRCNIQDYTMPEILEKIQAEYGGGDYRVHIRQGTQFLKNKGISIVERKKKEEPTPEKSDLADILRIMQEQKSQETDRLMDIMKMITQKNDNNSMNPFDMQSNMMAQMLQMKEFLGFDKKDKEQSPMATMKMFFEMQKMMKEFSEDNNDGGGGVLDVAKKFLPGIMDMAKKEQELNAQKQPTARKPPKINHDTIPDMYKQNPITETNEDNPAMNIKGHLNTLLIAAKMGTNPQTYANMIIDFTPEEKLETLHNFLEDENAVQNLIAINDKVKNHLEWFENLRVYTLEILNSMVVDDASGNDVLMDNGEHNNPIDGHSERPGGDTGNPKGNETVDESGQG